MPTLSSERRRKTTSHNATGQEGKEADETEASNFPQTPGEETAETKDPPLHQAENTAEATRRTSPELERRNKSFAAKTPSTQRTSAATKRILAREDTAGEDRLFAGEVVPRWQPSRTTSSTMKMASKLRRRLVAATLYTASSQNPWLLTLSGASAAAGEAWSRRDRPRRRSPFLSPSLSPVASRREWKGKETGHQIN